MVSVALWGLAGVAFFTLVGLAASELLPPLAALPLPRRLAYGYLLGIAAVAGSLYALSHWAAVPIRPLAILATGGLVVLAGAIARLLRRRRGPASPLLRRPPNAAERTALLLGGVVCAAVLAEAVSRPALDFDGRMTWSHQAKHVREEGTVTPSALQRKRVYVSHPRYPLLMPVAQVVPLELAGAGDDEHVFRPLYAAMLPALLLVVYDGARRLAGRTAAALTALAAGTTPFLAFTPEGGASGCYSDLPLGCFFGAGVVLLLLAPRPSLATGAAAGLLLAAATLTKQEGAILALGAVAVALAAAARRAWHQRRRPRMATPGALARSFGAVAVAGLLVGAALGLHLSWRGAIPNRFDEAYTARDLAALLAPGTLERLPQLLSAVAWESVNPRAWGLLGIAAPVLLLAGAPALRRRPVRPLLAAALLPLAVAGAAYAITPYPDYLVPVTWNRFLAQAVVPGSLLLAAALQRALHASGLAGALDARSPRPALSSPAAGRSPE